MDFCFGILFGGSHGDRVSYLLVRCSIARIETIRRGDQVDELPFRPFMRMSGTFGHVGSSNSRK